MPVVTFVSAGHYTVKSEEVALVKGASLTAARPVVGDGSAAEGAAGRELSSGTLNPSVWGNRAYLEVRSNDGGLLLQVVPFDSVAARDNALAGISAAVAASTPFVSVLGNGTVSTTPVS